jgi:hypothetical protein
MDMDMIFGTQYVRSLCRAGSLKTVVGKLAKYDLDLMADGLMVMVSQQMVIHFFVKWAC